MPSDTSSPVPAWLLWIGTLISLAGFFICAGFHVLAIADKPLPVADWIPDLLLEVGLAVVIIAAFAVTPKRFRAPSRRYGVRIPLPLPGVPAWWNYLSTALAIYVFGNFVVDLLQSANAPARMSGAASQGRSSTGLFMLFYETAAMIFYAAALAEADAPRCTRGHRMRDVAQLCPACGQPARLG